MPKVPTYDSQVAPAALPGVRQQSIGTPEFYAKGADGGLSAFGKGLGDFGQNVTNIAVQIQERDNLNAVLDISAKRTDAMAKMQADARANRQGDKAKNVLVETEDWWKKGAEEDFKALTNDAQREAYKKTMYPHRQQSLNSMSQFQFQQGEVVLEQNWKASNKAAIDSAASDPSPTGVALAADNIRRVNEAYAHQKGWQPGKDGQPGLLDVANKEALTNMYTAVIANLADKQPDAARALFEANKKDIAGGAYDNIEKLLKHGSVIQDGQNAVDHVRSKGMSEQQGLAYVRETYKGDARKAAESEVLHMFSQRETARNRAQAQLGDAAWNLVGKGATKISDIPGSMLTGMDGKSRIALEEYLANKAAGKGRVTDSGVYYDLRKMAKDTPNEFAKLDLRTVVNGLSPSDFEEFVKLQTSKPDQAITEASLARQFTTTFRQMGWHDSSNREQMGNFEATTRKAIQAEEKTLGKKLDDAGRQKVIDRMMVQGDTNGWIPGGSKRYGEVAGTGGTFAPKISDSDRAAVKATLVKNKIKVTDESIMAEYKRVLGIK